MSQKRPRDGPDDDGNPAKRGAATAVAVAAAPSGGAGPFWCPLCPDSVSAQRLSLGSEAELLDHVVLVHSSDTRAVVCPVCAARPGGDPNRTLQRTLYEHMALSHTGVSEEEMLRKAIEASLRMPFFKITAI